MDLRGLPRQGSEKALIWGGARALKIEFSSRRELNFQGPRAPKILTFSNIFLNIFWERSQGLLFCNLCRFGVHFGVPEEPYGRPSCPKGGDRICLFSPVEPTRLQDASQEVSKGPPSGPQWPQKNPKGINLVGQSSKNMSMWCPN